MGPLTRIIYLLISPLNLHMEIAPGSCVRMGWLRKEQATGQESRSANATLTGWKMILATVEVRDMLRKTGEMFCKNGAADSTANICAFMNRAKCKDVSAKVIATKLCLGVHVGNIGRTPKPSTVKPGIQADPRAHACWCAQGA